jgi:hypothetical protein
MERFEDPLAYRIINKMERILITSGIEFQRLASDPDQCIIYDLVSIPRGEANAWLEGEFTLPLDMPSKMSFCGALYNICVDDHAYIIQIRCAAGPGPYTTRRIY